MKAELLFPSAYLKAADLRGRDVTLTIKSVALVELPLRGTSQKKRRGVVTFSQTRKDGEPTLLVLNRTNCDTVIKLYGDETDNWAGKRITLYPTRVQFGRERVDAIRVRERAPQNGSKPADSAPEVYKDASADDWGDESGAPEAEAV